MQKDQKCVGLVHGQTKKPDDLYALRSMLQLFEGGTTAGNGSFRGESSRIALRRRIGGALAPRVEKMP